jgi:hypothetical protein
MESPGSRPPIKLAGLTLKVSPSALLGSLILWIILGFVGVYLLNFSLSKATILGLVAVVLHWVAVILHQVGHALAARFTGHPMTGIRLWGPLSSSEYPPDEPTLAKAIHIRRALGGPVLSVVVSVLALILLFFLRAESSSWWLTLFFFLDNLLVLTVGSLLPLGFTDGSTLLQLARSTDE